MNYWLLFFLQVLPLLVIILYLRNRRKFTYWEQRGVRGPKPWPFLGNGLESMRRGVIACDLEWRQKYGKVYGTYQGYKPVLCISDPELIKQVMIKDFGSFVNRQRIANRGEIDKHNLFSLEGDDWKRVRAIASPSFTSGKLRGMNALMNYCVDKLVAYFDRITKDGPGTAVIDTKEVLTGFTIDVIASTSFATETNANGDRTEKNQFVEEAKNRFKFPIHKILAAILLPKSIRVWTYWLIGPSEFEKESTFFHELAKQIIKQRRANPKDKRNDFVQLLMDASLSEAELSNSNFDNLTASADKDEEKNLSEESGNKSSKSLSDIEIIASSVLFFVAGFETTASTLTHCLFELATNQDVQERLYEEVSTALEGVDPKSVDFNEIVQTKVSYLEAVMKETLRKYPPLGRLERRVGVNGYKLGGITLEKDQLVQANAYVVQHSAEYYPEPERFNPDRFMPENKHLLVPYTFMPFGQGPRNCIGMRFAYQEIKLCLAKIITRFEFQPTEGTPEVLQLGKVALQTSSTFPLKVSRRA